MKVYTKEQHTTIRWLARNKQYVTDWNPYIDILGNEIIDRIINGKNLFRKVYIYKGKIIGTVYKDYEKLARALTSDNLIHFRKLDKNECLDHKICVYTGYLYNIPYNVISDKSNLQILTNEENFIKARKDLIDNDNSWIEENYIKNKDKVNIITHKKNLKTLFVLDNS